MVDRRLKTLMFLFFYGCALSFAWAEGKLFSGVATCYVLIEEGASSEGNSLFLNKMALESELLSRAAPTRFQSGSKIHLSTAEGSFSSEAEQPELVLRSGAFALYSVELRFKSSPFPKAKKNVKVSFSLADLMARGDIVQPAAMAIGLAAKAARMSSGRAWIQSMRADSAGAFTATVALSK